MQKYVKKYKKKKKEQMIIINSVKNCLKFNSENDKNFKKYAIT